ncbi:hypothetical protein [Caudoviricetes sp.]|nr:hypothetical protein [Caudoviricetes sp.]
MPEFNPNAVLAMVAYAAITGILNLLIAERSRVDAWATSHPRVAAALKLMRAVGFDPWHVIAAATLFFAKKLPEPKQPHAKIVPPGALSLLCLGLSLSQEACSAEPLKPPCDQATLAALTAQCAVDAAHCVKEGGSEEACGAVCDSRLDARAEECRK